MELNESMRLAGTVHVEDENGVFHVFGPGDDVPDWARHEITNPAAWAPDTETVTHGDSRVLEDSLPEFSFQNSGL